MVSARLVSPEICHPNNLLNLSTQVEETNFGILYCIYPSPLNSIPWPRGKDKLNSLQLQMASVKKFPVLVVPCDKLVILKV